MTDKTRDRFGPADIPKSRILKTEEYMDLRAKEIVDFVEGKELKEVTPKGLTCA